MQPQESKKEHFLSLLRECKFAMMTTRSLQGDLHGRPMVVAKVDEEADLYFVTDLQSDKVEELARDAQVSVNIQEGQKFLSLGGTAEVLRDRSEIKQVWSESWKVWFPQGPDDPNLVMLKVRPVIGEYWDNSGINGVRYLYRAAKAYVQGKRPHIDKDIQGKVELSHN